MNLVKLLVTISGDDRPGITSLLMKDIMGHSVKLLDMGQSVTHGLLSLSFYFEIKSSEQETILKNLLFTAKSLHLTMDYTLHTEATRSHISTEKFILNCVAIKDFSPHFLHDVAQILAENQVNILRIDNIAPDEFKVLEVTTSIPKNLDIAPVKKAILDLGSIHEVDMAFLKDNIFRRSKRLIVFDMDSTLIQAEVIDELARAHGVYNEVASITTKAMEGKLDFNESLHKRVQMLKGLKETVLQEILDELPLTPGCQEFIDTVRSLGYKVALISGGFTFFAEGLKEKLGLDYAFANELEIKNGELTGKVIGTIVDAAQKETLLKLIAQQEKINMEQVVAIGDGANDLPMLEVAGLGIAFHAKKIVKEQAGQNMSYGPMTSILYFLGIPGPQLP